MSIDFLEIVIKTIFSLFGVVLLIYVSFRLSGSSLNKLQSSRFIQIIERASVSKDNSMLVARIGNEYYLVTSTHERLEIIRKLEANETDMLKERLEKNNIQSLTDLYSNFKRKGRLK